MSTQPFTEEDKQKLLEFLNQVALHATFSVKTSELISIFKNLSYMQQVLLPKINNNIFEVKKIVQAPIEDKIPKAKKGS